MQRPPFWRGTDGVRVQLGRLLSSATLVAYSLEFVMTRWRVASLGDLRVCSVLLVFPKVKEKPGFSYQMPLCSREVDGKSA